MKPLLKLVDVVFLSLQNVLRVTAVSLGKMGYELHLLVIVEVHSFPRLHQLVPIPRFAYLPHM